MVFSEENKTIIDNIYLEYRINYLLFKLFSAMYNNRMIFKLITNNSKYEIDIKFE